MTAGIILPTPSRPTIDATQMQNAFLVQWDLTWPNGTGKDPENILQTIERSQFPEGPWKAVGTKIPGTVTHFVDLTVPNDSWFQKHYYRVIVRRAIR